MTDVTQILSQTEHGDRSAAEKLLPLVYDELRKLAAARLAHGAFVVQARSDLGHRSKYECRASGVRTRGHVGVGIWCAGGRSSKYLVADHRRHGSGVWTPTIDALAAKGVRYDKAFTITPVCSTSRSGFCTGMHPISIGAHQHRTKDEHKKPLAEGVKVVTDWFRDAGYWTANIKSMGGKRFGTGKVDWDFAYEGRPFDGDKWEDLKTKQPFYAQVNFGQSHRGWGAPEQAVV